MSSGWPLPLNFVARFLFYGSEEYYLSRCSRHMVLLTINVINCGPFSYNVQVSNLSIVTLENINIENDIASNLYLSFNF